MIIQNEGGSWSSAGRVANSAWDKKIYGADREQIFSAELCVGTGLGIHGHHEDWERMIQGSAGLNQKRGTGTLGKESEMQAQENNTGGNSWMHLAGSIWQSVSLGFMLFRRVRLHQHRCRLYTVPSYMVFSLV